MVIFIHGEDQAASRNFLNEQVLLAKTKNKEIIRLDGSKVELSEIKQNLEANSLFGQEKLVIIENLFSSPKSKRQEEIITYFKKLNTDVDLLFWEKKELGKIATNKLPNGCQIKVFKIPAIIFKFLDSIKPKNNNLMLSLFHQCLKTQPPEMVFYMLARQLRILLLANDLGEDGLSGPSWMKSRFIHQAKNFKLEQLKKIYKQLLEIDINVKTGSTPMSLAWQLDLLLSQL